MIGIEFNLDFGLSSANIAFIGPSREAGDRPAIFEQLGGDSRANYLGFDPELLKLGLELDNVTEELPCVATPGGLTINASLGSGIAGFGWYGNIDGAYYIGTPSVPNLKTIRIHMGAGVDEYGNIIFPVLTPGSSKVASWYETFVTRVDPISGERDVIGFDQMELQASLFAGGKAQKIKTNIFGRATYRVTEAPMVTCTLKKIVPETSSISAQETIAKTSGWVRDPFTKKRVWKDGIPQSKT